jgi:hypothetical protein
VLQETQELQETTEPAINTKGPIHVPRIQVRMPAHSRAPVAAARRAHAAGQQHAPPSPRLQGPLGDITNTLGLRIVQLRPPPPLKTKAKLLKTRSHDIRAFCVAPGSG